MATIIVGRFQLQEQAELATKQLIQAGFATEKISSFYVNPPGQHAAYPIGGDRYKSPSPGATELDGHPAERSVTVEVVEAVIGVDPSRENHADDHSPESNDPSHAIPPIRKAGMLVAVELANQGLQDQVVFLLTKLGARDIEKLEGEIVDSEWRDFNPLSEPSYL